MAAARKLQDAGYEVRLRIDPVMFYKGWENDYIALVRRIFEHVRPSRITIGEYRPSKGLAGHIAARFPHSPLLQLNRHLVSDGVKLRYPEDTRVSMFRTVVNEIRRHDRSVAVSLCKEDTSTWKALGMPLNGLQCNCTP